MDYWTIPYSITLPTTQHATMSLTCQFAARQCARTLRSSPAATSRCIAAQSYRSRDIQSRRWQSTDAAAAPTNPKIAGIVDQISQLTLLETADLVSSLKVCIACG